jgi:parallel beta-helix repeat protein
MVSRSTVFLISILLLSIAVLLPSHTSMVKAEGSIVRVPGDFSTIQEAINAAQNGSTILVSSGVYFEQLTINKTLTLLGEDRMNTIVDGSNSGSVVTVTADNAVIDGFTVRNGSTGMDSIGSDGIRLEHSTGSTIRGNIVTLTGEAGIELNGSANNTVSGNIVTSTIGNKQGLVWGCGIILDLSTNNTIDNNVIADSTVAGILIQDSYNNSIVGNTIQNNVEAVLFGTPTAGNVFFDNNFLNNPPAPVDGPSSNNTWSHEGRGNYWEDYFGLDDGSGGGVAGDGVGDTGLPCHDLDYFPLINPVNPLPTLLNNTAFPVSVVSNSTIYARQGAQFGFIESNTWFAFQVVGPANTTGYFNLTIPKTLLIGPWQIGLDGNAAQADISENQTHTTIHLSYSNNQGHYILAEGVDVMPEYPTPSAIVIILLLLLVPTILTAKKRKRTRS